MRGKENRWDPPPVSTLYSYFSITLSKISNTYSLKEERLIKAQHFRVVHPIIDQ